MNETSYTAWNDNLYEWPPPEGWYQAHDGRWWPEGYGPSANGTAKEGSVDDPDSPDPTADSSDPTASAPADDSDRHAESQRPVYDELPSIDDVFGGIDPFADDDDGPAAGAVSDDDGPAAGAVSDDDGPAAGAVSDDDGPAAGAVSDDDGPLAPVVDIGIGGRVSVSDGPRRPGPSHPEDFGDAFDAIAEGLAGPSHDQDTERGDDAADPRRGATAPADSGDRPASRRRGDGPPPPDEAESPTGRSAASAVVAADESDPLAELDRWPNDHDRPAPDRATVGVDPVGRDDGRGDGRHGSDRIDHIDDPGDGHVEGAPAAVRGAWPLMVAGLLLAFLAAGFIAFLFLGDDGDDGDVASTGNEQAVNQGAPGSLSSPYPFGKAVVVYYADQVDDGEHRWIVQVLEPVSDRTEQLVTGAGAAQPAAGEVLALARVRVTYETGPTTGQLTDLRLNAVGPGGTTVYDQAANGCSAVIDPINLIGELAESESVEGNVCWQVSADDFTGLLLAVEAGPAEGRVHMALR